MSRTTPRHRMRTVSRRTGVPAATLRSWERRYGFPKPQRTASSYRLYSDVDVEQIAHMRRLCCQGFSASEAARTVLQASAHAASGPGPEVEHLFEDGIRKLVDAAAAMDVLRMHQHLQWIVTLSDPVEVYEWILAPALQRVGRMWQEGELSMAQEHLLHEGIGTVLRELLQTMQRPDPLGTVVLGCIADEFHTLGVYGVGMRCAAWDLRPIILGPHTPPEAIREARERLHPAFIGLSITLTRPDSEARALLAEYASACGDTPWLAGGPGADAVAHLIEALPGGQLATTTDVLQNTIDRVRRAHGLD